MPSDLLHFTAPMELEAKAAGKVPTISGVVYSGGVLRLPGGPYVVDLSAAEVGGNIPVLVGHSGDDLDAIAGQGTASIRGGEIHFSGRLTDATPGGQKAIALGKAGINPQASIGFMPIKREFVAAGKTVRVNDREFTAGPEGLVVVRAGQLREVSLVATGADPENEITIQAKGLEFMNESTTQPTFDPMLQAAWENPALSASERVVARWNAVKISDATVRARIEPLMHAALAGKLDFGTFENHVLRAERDDCELRAIRSERPMGPAIRSPSEAPTADVLAGMFLCRAGHEDIGVKHLGEQAMVQARSTPVRHVLDIFAAAVRAEKGHVPANQNDLIRAAFSTYILPTALGNSLEKLALDQYRDAPATWRSFCGIRPAKNFREHTGIRLSDAMTLDEIGKGGEIHHARLGESTYSYRISTYSKMVTLTRQDIIDDDLGMFNQIPALFGRSASRKLADLVYTVLLANGGSFFSAGNGNLLEASSALAVGPLGNAVKALRNQVDTDGSPLDLVPKVLVVGPSLEVTARQLLNSLQLQRYVASGTDNQPQGNPFAGLSLVLEVEPRLEAAAFTGYSTTQWYLSCGPIDGAVIVSFLNGQQNPTVEQVDVGANQLGAGWRVFVDYGAALADGKAIVKATGAGAG